MAELFAFFVHDQTTSGREFGADKPDESAQDAKDNDQNAQQADSETGMMKIVHLDFPISRRRAEILTLSAEKNQNGRKELPCDPDAHSRLNRCSRLSITWQPEAYDGT